MSVVVEDVSVRTFAVAIYAQKTSPFVASRKIRPDLKKNYNFIKFGFMLDVAQSRAVKRSVILI